MLVSIDDSGAEDKPEHAGWLNQSFWWSHPSCAGLSSASESSILLLMEVSLAQHERRVG